MQDTYHPNEDDILAMLHYLRLTAPELAVPENAIKLLNYMHLHSKAMENFDSELLQTVLSDLEDY